MFCCPILNQNLLEKKRNIHGGKIAYKQLFTHTKMAVITLVYVTLF